ncbi:MAG: hypothetical protein ACRC9R_07405 [Enterovibrio sp.]
MAAALRYASKICEDKNNGDGVVEWLAIDWQHLLGLAEGKLSIADVDQVAILLKLAAIGEYYA